MRHKNPDTLITCRTLVPTRLSLCETAGFTLIEVLAVAGIVLVGFVLGVHSIISASATRAQAADRVQIEFRVSSVVDELLRATSKELQVYVPPDYSNDNPPTVFKIEYVVDEKRASVVPPFKDEKVILPNPVEVRVAYKATRSSGRTLSGLETLFVEHR